MDILLYYNNSERNVVDKTLALAFTLSGYLRDESSVIDPVIEIRATADISLCNYAYISEFHRYYYIRNIEVIRTNLYRLTLHSDPLTSFKDSILANSGTISRQENNWDLYLNDEMFKIDGRRRTQTYPFDTAFKPTLDYVLVFGGGAT